jgi:hypothetical protein
MEPDLLSRKGVVLTLSCSPSFKAACAPSKQA